MDIRLALMAGSNIPVPECQIEVHQPTLKEISMIGEQDFFVGVQCLCIYKSMINQGESVLVGVTNFQIFMTVMNEKETSDKKHSVLQVLALIFPNYKAMFTPRSIVLQSKDHTAVIDESNFDALQEALRQIFCAKDGPMDQQAFNPANEEARKIAEKIMRGRQKVAELKGTANASIFSLYTSILSVALKISLNEIMNYTMYQLYDIMDRYSLYINWDLDIRTRLAGGKPDSQPENWMKPIH